MVRSLAVLAGLVLLLPACSSGDGESAPAGGKPATVTVTSSAFHNGKPVPQRYTCHGRGVSPPLAWSHVPSGAKELALVVDDPDAPKRRYVHWLVVGIDPSAKGVATGHTPAGGTVVANSGGDRKYLGPCPPAGTGVHHYRFTVYAFDEPLRLGAGAKADDAVAEIDEKASDWGRLTGTYRG